MKLNYTTLIYLLTPSLIIAPPLFTDTDTDTADSYGRIGCDVERTSNRASAHLKDRVLTKSENSRLGGLTYEDKLSGERVAVSKEEEVLLRFSFKESVYKAIHPYLARSVDFDEVEVDPTSDGGAIITFQLKSSKAYRDEFPDRDSPSSSSSSSSSNSGDTGTQGLSGFDGGSGRALEGVDRNVAFATTQKEVNGVNGVSVGVNEEHIRFSYKARWRRYEHRMQDEGEGKEKMKGKESVRSYWLTFVYVRDESGAGDPNAKGE